MPQKNATDKFRRLAKLPGTDPLQPGPSRYRHGALGHAAVARAFFLIWEDLAWTPALAIRPLRTPHTSQTPFVSSLTRPREFCPRTTAQ